MKSQYSKLVRDKVPEIIQRSAKSFQCVTLSDAEYVQALGKKLVEEAQETAIALDSGNSEELLEELADLYEVIDAILTTKDIQKAQASAKQTEKRLERGGFEKRIKLLWVEDKMP